MTRHSISFDITTRTHAELMDKYGIEIYEDGSVFDPCDYNTYDNLRLWASAMDDDEESYENNRAFLARTGGKHDYWEE